MSRSVPHVRSGSAALGAESQAADRLDAHLEAQGFAIGSEHDAIEAGLRDAMGRSRYGRYLRTADSVRRHLSPIDRLYQAARTLEEANLLMSHQAREMRASFLALLRAARPFLVEGAKVADLGTFTGALASFIAREHPGVAVVGIDRLGHLVRLARRRDAAVRNLEYEILDYAKPPRDRPRRFNVLLSSFGIESPATELDCGLQVTDLRRGRSYEGTRASAAQVLRSWRAMAAPGARLLAVLRLPLVEDVLGVVDAASEAGWAWRRGLSGRVRVGDEMFTRLGWIAADSPAPPVLEDALLALDAGTTVGRLTQRIRGGERLEVSGAAAVLAYRVLDDAQVHRGESRVFDDGHVMRKEIGRAGKRAFVLTRADTGFTHLVLGGEREEDVLAARYETEFWEGAACWPLSS